MPQELIFGYRKITGGNGSPAMSIELYREGTLIYRTEDPENGSWQKVTFSVSDFCISEVLRIIRDSAPTLQRCASEINDGHLSLDGENYFIFGNLRIIDWDLTRWYLEEDRRKHPEYYKNSVRVELTETYVRGIFDEICAILEQDEKQIRHAKALYSDL